MFHGIAWCRDNRLPQPSYNILSDRRGKRTAWSCTVTLKNGTSGFLVSKFLLDWQTRCPCLSWALHSTEYNSVRAYCAHGVLSMYHLFPYSLVERLTSDLLTPTMKGQTASALYWYDGQFVNGAKEDAAEQACRQIGIDSPIMEHAGPNMSGITNGSGHSMGRVEGWGAR